MRTLLVEPVRVQLCAAAPEAMASMPRKHAASRGRPTHGGHARNRLGVDGCHRLTEGSVMPGNPPPGSRNTS